MKLKLGQTCGALQRFANVPRLLPVFLVLAVICSPRIGWGEDICSGLQAEFADLFAGKATTGPHLGPLGADRQCAAFVGETGQMGEVCYWRYGLRDGSARLFAARLSASLERCATALPEDLAVNHPDSYLLRRYAFGAGDLSLSVKDKTALSQTLLFLSFVPAQ